MRNLFTFVIIISLEFFVITLTKCSINVTNKRTIDDEYYYDYELIPNNTKIKIRPEALIIPELYTNDVLPSVELPDDSLADTDLRDHDFIDNLMYVYYGSHNKNQNNYGPEIIIIGSVLSCTPQLLTIFIVLLKKNSGGKREVNCIFLQIIICLCISNLVFMLGVYSTKNSIKCQIIGLLLYYMHLLTAFWFFMYVVYVYKKFCNYTLPKLRIFYSIVYGVPGIITTISFIISSFETKRFCFVSVQKGMIINYMLPVSMLIIATTILSLNGIRKINLELSKLEFTSSAESINALRSDNDDKKIDCTEAEIVSLKECKKCLKSLCGIETSYNIVWFVAVLALENINNSPSMPVVYSITSCLLNWYICAKSKSFLPTIVNNRLKLVDDNLNNQGEIKVVTSSNTIITRYGSADSVPLLIASETEMREIVRHEYISTISS